MIQMKKKSRKEKELLQKCSQLDFRYVFEENIKDFSGKTFERASAETFSAVPFYMSFCYNQCLKVKYT